MLKKYCVYAHRKASNGEIFYIGKGARQRPKSRSNRSLRWRHTVAKHGLQIEIIKSDMSEACAFTLEKILISSIGRDKLCNLSTGGDGGMSGYKFNRDVVVLKAQKCMKPVINSAGDIFPSLKSAAKKMRAIGYNKATESHISSCCTGKRHMAYGFSWSFDTSKTPELVDHVSKVNEKRLIRVMSSNGVIFESISSAAEWVRKNLGVKCGTSDISRCCKGKRKFCGGLEWKYLL